nr:MAG TPA: hypothetical protein [Caudoviricetes sp.]
MPLGDYSPRSLYHIGGCGFNIALTIFFHSSHETNSRFINGS